MHVLLWFQSCAIVALAVYVFYVRRKSARSDSQKKGEALSSEPNEEKMPEALSMPVDTEEKEADEVTCISDAKDVSDRELFERIHHLIVSDKLFLDPAFSREHVIKLALVNKNKVAKMFRQFAHTNFNGYVNALRLEYALALMHSQPEMPIKAVAYDAGFNSVRTFYRAFEKAYGKTPVEYKASLPVSIKKEVK